MRQDQDIKGFTILELLVVITIVAVVSAVGYPNFMDWRKDREVRVSAEKIANLITGVNTQAQRGYFPFVQFYIDPQQSSVKFYAKGISQSTLSNLLNAGTKISCPMTNSSYWDNHEINLLNINIGTHVNGASAVCFSKDGSYYKLEGKLKNNFNLIIEGRTNAKDYVIICTTENAIASGGNCAINQANGLEKPAYLVEWTRFGNVSKYKWSGSAWNRL